MRGVKTIAAIAGLLFCAALGVLAAVTWDPHAALTEGSVLRVRQGVTETGRVEAVTAEGQVRRVVRWNTRQGVETQTIEGPLRVRVTRGGTTLLATPHAPFSVRETSVSETVTVVGETLTTTIVETVTLPPETITETATETVLNTSTETVTPPDEGIQDEPN
jgi:hypothetical protein